VAQPAAWPNPEAQALCRSWDTHTGLKDAAAPVQNMCGAAGRGIIYLQATPLRVTSRTPDD
jgi:hypothetical protein